MASGSKRVPEGLILTFKIISIISRVLIIPVLALSVLMATIVFGSKPLNNISNGVELPQYKATQNVKAGWGYYLIPVVSDLGVEDVYYAKKTDLSEIEQDTVIVFYDVVNKNAEPYEYRINVKPIRGTAEVDGEVLYEFYTGPSVPAINIIGEVVEEIPGHIKFILTNLSSVMNLVLYGVVPLVVFFAVFVIDSTMQIKRQKGTVQRPKLLTRTEEENENYFEQLKKVYAAPREDTSKQLGDEDKNASAPLPPKAKPAPSPAKSKPAPKAPPVPKTPPVPMTPKTKKPTPPPAPRPPKSGPKPPVPPKKG